MTVLSMPVLPDCTRCGGPVVLVIDGDGSAREVCAACGLSLRPMPPKPDRQAIRTAARQVVAQARREGLPRLRCPSCKRGRCGRCHVVTCECTDNDHPRRPDAEA